MRQRLQPHHFHLQSLVGCEVQGALLSQLVIQVLHQMSLYAGTAFLQVLQLKPAVLHALNSIQVAGQLAELQQFACEIAGASHVLKLPRIALS